MIYSTPKLLGDEYLDGFLWGKANFSYAKKTRKANINVTYMPTDLVIDFIERLEQYAKIELKESTKHQNKQVTEIIDITFNSPVYNPYGWKERELQSYWNEDFLKGVIYSRLYMSKYSNQLIISKQTWTDIISEILSTYKIPFNIHRQRIFILREGNKHPFFKEWIGANENDNKRDAELIESIDFESLPISKDTGFAKSHDQIRYGFNGNNKDIICSIRGVFEGRLFWFRDEILSLISHDDEEIKFEARLALLHIGTSDDIQKLQRLENQEQNDQISSDNSLYKIKIKRIKNTIDTYKMLLDKKNYDSNNPPFYDLINAFCNWLTIEEQEEENADNIYIELFSNFIDKKSNEIDFVINRICEMKNRDELSDYWPFFDKIIKENYDDEGSIDL